MNTSCYYCNNLFIMSEKRVSYIIIELLDKINRTTKKKYMDELLNYMRMSKEINISVSYFDPEIYNKIKDLAPITSFDVYQTVTILYLNDKFNKTKHLTKCSFCLKNACDYHSKFFSFYKCEVCDNYVSKCDWCDEKNRFNFCPKVHTDINEENHLKGSSDIVELMTPLCSKCGSRSNCMIECDRCNMSLLCDECYFDELLCDICTTCCEYNI